MKLHDIVEYVALGFSADKFKTLMSSLGIIIGVLAIVATLSVGEGLYSGVFDELGSMDIDTVHVVPGVVNMGGGSSTPSDPAKLTDKDVKAIKNVVGVKYAAPQWYTGVKVSFRDKNSSASLNGISPKEEKKLEDKVVVGRFLEESDYKAIVIGHSVSEDLFRMKISPGNRLRLYYDERPTDFKVVGVLQEEEEMSMVGGNLNMQMYITHRAMEDLVDKDDYHYDEIRVVVENPEKVDEVAKDIERDIARYHKDESYTVITQKSILGSIENMLRMIKFALAGIGAISLVVGGIGISNVMMLTVKDRVREIGVMKAIGATTRDIRTIYLLEAGALGLTSSIIGVTIGALASAVIGSMGGLPTAVTPTSVLAGLAFGIFATLIAGAYPANKAAQLDPIEALRAE